MNGLLHSARYTERHSHHVLEVIRIYLGLVLFMQGIYFIRNTSAFVEAMRGGDVPMASAALAHYIITAHIVGGLMIALGMMTRFAALVQMPILLGALLFLGSSAEMLAAAGVTPAFTIWIALLMGLFAWYGSGRWSVDRWIRRGEIGDLRQMPGHGHAHVHAHSAMPPMH